MTKRTGKRSGNASGEMGPAWAAHRGADADARRDDDDAHSTCWRGCTRSGWPRCDAVFREEAEALAGPKGRHQRERTHHHWGTTATELTFGGRRIQVRRPRVRSRAGQEAALPSVAAFRARDPLTARMMSRSAGRVDARLCGQSGGGAGGRRQPRESKSAVSRTLVPAPATTTARAAGAAPGRARGAGAVLGWRRGGAARR